jgi:uncharacterized membrane protein
MKFPSIQKIATILFWILVFLVSINFYVSNVYPYFEGNLTPRLEAEKWWLMLHFTCAGCTLFLGPLQFIPYIRNNYRRWHRVAGKIYIIGSVVSALTVFVLLSNYTLPGAVPSLGFLAIIWLFTTIAAYWFAVKKNFKYHRHFMIRSYVCGLAFVFIRIMPILNDFTGVFDFIKDDEMRFTVYEWVCWVYPLLFTEFLLVWWPSLRTKKES